MTWEIAVVIVGAGLLGWFVGVAMGYTRGRIDGRMEIAREILRGEEGEG
jgi:hypothetical protein